jgi:hypothetical protein
MKLIVAFLYFATGLKNVSTPSERELARYKIVIDVGCFNRAEYDTDCDMVVAKVMERLTANTRVVYKCKFRLF